jgi:uncharacterized protein involved in outer membrane biogenesis
MNTPGAGGRRRWPRAVGAAVAVLLLLFALGEVAGWPFLGKPAERWIANALDRRVQFGDGDDRTRDGLRVRFLGGLRLWAPSLEIGAPRWSADAYMLRAKEASLRLRYRDLLAMRRGERLRVEGLEAATLDLKLERRNDGQASWQFGPPRATRGDGPELPSFGRLLVRDGRLSYVDAPLALAMEGTATLRDSSRQAATGASAPTGPASGQTDPSTAMAAAARPAASGASGAAGDTTPVGLRLSATGRQRDTDFSLHLDSGSLLPLFDESGSTPPVDVRIDARSGASRLRFDGTARDALRLDRLAGRFDVAGPSLSSLGDVLGVTLPTTERFQLAGRLRKEAAVWSVLVDDAQVGASKLNGAFRFEGDRRPRPLLAGRLGGAQLRFVDLAPAVGAPVEGIAPPPKKGHVLPDREFDIPSLRKMDANVLVDIASVDLGSAFGEPMRPLHTHLRLDDGFLQLSDLDVRTAQGRVRGGVTLDSRPPQPLWHARLGWSDIALDRWLRQERGKDKPPYIAGRLGGRADLRGVGRSTAGMLSTLQGEATMRLRQGQVSHLAIEMAGIDLAESLGLFIKGDDALPVGCAVGQFVVDKGIARPRVLIVDTPDSTVWIDGQVSLRDEALALRATVAPKDMSPLSLRTPLHVNGTFTDPKVSLEKGPVVRKLAAAGLLAALSPLAALLPGVDTGAAAPDDGGEAGCERLIRLAGTPAVHEGKNNKLR